MKNIVFWFSGTGNSLQAAKTILKELGGGEAVSMARPGRYCLTGEYDTIGFVFPLYYLGLPKAVHGFVANLDIGNNKDAYYYAIMTCGGAKTNSGILQVNNYLSDMHGIRLAYGQRLVMVPNNVLIYDMMRNTSWYMRNYEKSISKAVNNIKIKHISRMRKPNALLNYINKKFIERVSAEDRNYTVDDACNGCGICEEVCPVKNINMADGKPKYNNNCEQCVACIQYCPQKAIDYKNRTQNRRRYTNPEISYKELSKYNNM